jgi:hypothetical protein
MDGQQPAGAAPSSETSDAHDRPPMTNPSKAKRQRPDGDSPEEVASLEAKLRDVEADLAETTKSLERVKRDRDSLKKESQRDKGKIQQYVNNVTALEGVQKTNADLVTRLQQEVVQERNAKEDALRNLMNANANPQIQVLTDANTRLRQDLENANKQMTDACLQRDQQIKAIDKDRADLRAQLDKLNGQVRALESDKANLVAANTAFDAANKKLQNDLRDSQNSVNAKVDALIGSKVIEIGKVVEKTNGENEELKQEIRVLKQQLQDESTLVARFQTEAATLRVNLAQSKKENEDAINELKKHAPGLCHPLSADVCFMTAEEAEKIHKAFEAEKQGWRNDMAKLLQREEKGLKDLQTALGASVQQANTDRQDRDIRIQALTAQITGLQADIDRLRGENDGLRRENSAQSAFDVLFAKACRVESKGAASDQTCRLCGRSGSDGGAPGPVPMSFSFGTPSRPPPSPVSSGPMPGAYSFGASAPSTPERGQFSTPPRAAPGAGAGSSFSAADIQAAKAAARAFSAQVAGEFGIRQPVFPVGGGGGPAPPMPPDGAQYPPLQSSDDLIDPQMMGPGGQCRLVLVKMFGVTGPRGEAVMYAALDPKQKANSRIRWMMYGIIPSNVIGAHGKPIAMPTHRALDVDVLADLAVTMHDNVSAAFDADKFKRATTFVDHLIHWHNRYFVGLLPFKSEKLAVGQRIKAFWDIFAPMFDTFLVEFYGETRWKFNDVRTVEVMHAAKCAKNPAPPTGSRMMLFLVNSMKDPQATRIGRGIYDRPADDPRDGSQLLMATAEPWP